MVEVGSYRVTVHYSNFDWESFEGKSVEMIDVVKLLCDIARDTDVRSFTVVWVKGPAGS